MKLTKLLTESIPISIPRLPLDSRIRKAITPLQRKLGHLPPAIIVFIHSELYYKEDTYTELLSDSIAAKFRYDGRRIGMDYSPREAKDDYLNNFIEMFVNDLLDLLESEPDKPLHKVVLRQADVTPEEVEEDEFVSLMHDTVEEYCKQDPVGLVDEIFEWGYRSARGD